MDQKQQKRVVNIVIAIVIGIVVYMLSSLILNTTHALLLGSIAFLVTLWTNDGLPMGVVSLLPLLIFPLMGLLDFKTIAPKYASPIIFLFIGGFLLALAVQKTNLHKVMADKLLKFFPSTPLGVIYALAISSAILSAILSNTTITLMLLPIAVILTDNLKLKKRFLIATAYGASIGGILTPIGTPPNLILLGFMENVGLAPITFLQWIVLMAPLVIAMLLIVPYILSIGVRNEGITKYTSGTYKLTKDQKKLAWVLIILLLLLVLNSPIEPFYPGIGINEKMILLGFGLLMFVPGFAYLKWEDVAKLPFQIVFLFGAGFSIAEAFTTSDIVTPISGALGGLTTLPLIATIVVVALFVSFSTEVTSNTALIAMALPIFFGLSGSLGGSFFLLVPTIAASYAFMLPIATPPNAIVMSTGELKIKELAKIGFFINILGVLLLTVVAYFYWQLFSFG